MAGVVAVGPMSRGTVYGARISGDHRLAVAPAALVGRRHLQRFDQTKKFSTWVYTIASNLSKNELRNRSRSPLVLFQKLEKSWDEDHRPIQQLPCRWAPSCDLLVRAPPHRDTFPAHQPGRGGPLSVWCRSAHLGQESNC